jgi:tRNA (guanine-N7-)-methyltransferase
MASFSDSSAPVKGRPIRSFVLREGRLTPGQERAFADHWPFYGVDLGQAERLTGPLLFGNDHPLWLEIGFGDGEALLAAAQAHPERNYLGIEVHRPGVGHLLRRAAEEEVHNLRLIRDDALQVMAQHLAPASLSGLQLFFPDPWHKKRHHKRRLVRPAFVAQCARLLVSGGLLHMATDWEDYAEQMMRELSASADFENCAGPGRYSPRPETRPQTKFERRGQRLGHGVWDLLFRRLN